MSPNSKAKSWGLWQAIDRGVSDSKMRISSTAFTWRLERGAEMKALPLISGYPRAGHDSLSQLSLTSKSDFEIIFDSSVIKNSP